ncbi:DUF2750 domain-containing protein [Gemmata sp.]|uniref:DUF2750 domain-containing protein n=1 Tax=Gemmata sp. TaxID=1914242 RepID=UPI003F6ECC67
MRFVREVADSEVVWGIRMTRGFANWDSGETGEWSVMPFWSTREEAELLADQFEGGEPAPIPLFDFLYRWLPNMVNDYFMPAAKCTTDREGIALRSSDLQDRIHRRLAEFGRLPEYQARSRESVHAERSGRR